MEKEAHKDDNLIGKFMGDFKLVKEFKPEPDRDTIYCWLKTSNRVISDYDIPEWRDYSTNKEYVEMVRYKSSWDWLMPVVEKIEGFHDGLEYQVVIYEDEVTILQKGDLQWKEIVNVPADGNGKKANTYKAIIEFLTWYYNKTDNKNG